MSIHEITWAGIARYADANEVGDCQLEDPAALAGAISDAEGRSRLDVIEDLIDASRGVDGAAPSTLLRELLDSLPKCIGCGAPATLGGEQGTTWCDGCGEQEVDVEDVVKAPWRDVVRKIQGRSDET